jgi:hypothetical protein
MMLAAPPQSTKLFAEGVVRGHKGVLLTSQDYASLQQCESLDDIKLFLVRWCPWRRDNTSSSALLKTTFRICLAILHASYPCIILSCS